MRPKSRITLFASLVGVAALAGMHLAAADTTPYTSPGTGQDFTVPTGVCSVTVDAAGAEGGSAGSQSFLRTGGLGASISGTFAVTPGEHLGINVGGRGSDGFDPTTPGAGGINGGGDGGDHAVGNNARNHGAGGGGASDVRQAHGGSGCTPACVAPTPPATAGSTPAERVITAGGGGGGGGGIINLGGDGGDGGGDGIGPDPESGDGESNIAADGGQAGATGGTGGETNVPPNSDGEDGTTDGEGGDGGDGVLRGAGGGGGGATGGGGGGGGGAGGGGGSSATAPSVTNVTSESGVQEDDGEVILSYSATEEPACVLGVAVAAAIQVDPAFAG